MSKIKVAQIDPNGLCNSGCWFCPVSYASNPEIGRKTMPVETLESVLRQLVAGRGDFVDEHFNFVYTAHYNEVLLYKHYDEMLRLFRKYGLKTMVLTNGTPLTPARTDLIKEYQDVVQGICFNIPSSNAEQWSKLVKMPEKMFDKLTANIKYAIDNLPDMFNEKRISIQVNGVNNNSLVQYGGWLEMLPNSPKLDFDPQNGDLSKEERGFTELFPGMNVFQQPYLIDRAGHLDKHGVMTNMSGINNHAKAGGKTKVIGCNSGAGDWIGRPTSWLHINANGDTFICCNDYDFETIFGNVNCSLLKDIWMSKEHKDMTQNAFNTICTTCSAAVWA